MTTQSENGHLMVALHNLNVRRICSSIWQMATFDDRRSFTQKILKMVLFYIFRLNSYTKWLIKLFDYLMVIIETIGFISFRARGIGSS